MDELYNEEDSIPPDGFHPDTLNNLERQLPYFLATGDAIVPNILRLWALRSTSNDLEELCTNLGLLRMALGRKDLRAPGNPTWSALVRSGKVAEMYMNFAQSDGFFEEDPIVQAHVLGGLVNLAAGCVTQRERTIGLFLLSRCPALFQVMWQNMGQHFHFLNQSENARGVKQCVAAFSGLHDNLRGCPPDMPTFIPHIAAGIWVHCDDVRFAPLSLGFLVKPYGPASEEDIDLFVRGAILSDQLGADSVIACFKRTLDGLVRGDGDYPLYLLANMAQISRHSSIRPFVHKHNIFPQVIALLNHRSRSRKVNARDVEFKFLEWQLARPIFEWVTPLMSRKDALTLTANLSIVSQDWQAELEAVRGEHIIAYIAHGSRVIAQMAPQWQSDEEDEMSERCTGLVELLQLYHAYGTSAEYRAKAPVLMNGILRGARAQWIPTLDALRAVRRSTGGVSWMYDSLVLAWQEFGASMGLDEDQERKRTSRYRAYQPCTHSTEVPPTQLSACTGCKEVRYCGKECQRGDRQNHKSLCGKRLKFV